MVLLVNRSTASASEVLAGALHDNGRSALNSLTQTNAGTWVVGVGASGNKGVYVVNGVYVVKRLALHVRIPNIEALHQRTRHVFNDRHCRPHERLLVVPPDSRSV